MHRSMDLFVNRGEGNLDERVPNIRRSTRLLERNTYPYPSYQDCLDSIEDVAKDKSTFYSGLGYYPNGAGYQYLKDFIAARGLLEVDSVYPDDFCTSDPNLNGGKSSPSDEDHTRRPCNDVHFNDYLSYTKWIPSLTVCPTDPPLPSGGSSASGSATATTTATSATATSTTVPQDNPVCAASIGVVSDDAMDAESTLSGEGNGDSNNNCCAGGAVPCQQIAVSGTAVVDLCAGTTQQCAGCSNLAQALKDIIIDCDNNYMTEGNVTIPYLDGVSLQLNENNSS
ncbi:hypothetical protein ACLMJK_003305 [Lecanora helva]